MCGEKQTWMSRQEWKTITVIRKKPFLTFNQWSGLFSGGQSVIWVYNQRLIPLKLCSPQPLKHQSMEEFRNSTSENDISPEKTDEKRKSSLCAVDGGEYEHQSDLTVKMFEAFIDFFVLAQQRRRADFKTRAAILFFSHVLAFFLLPSVFSPPVTLK